MLYFWSVFFFNPHYMEFMNIIEGKGLDAEINYKLIDYFSSGHCAIVMKSNKISIHVASGDTIVDENDTYENIYKFLAPQLDENKKLIRSILRYGDTIENYDNVFIPSMQDMKDQWELDIHQFPYSKIFVAQYNRRRLHGENPILYRHNTVTDNEVLIETVNENNWHQFLKDSIETITEMVPLTRKING